MMKSHQIRPVIMIIFSAIIAACGGGNANNPSPLSSSNPNPDISGHILSVDEGWLWKMNLGTGRFTKISEARYRGSKYSLSPAVYKGDEFILRIRDCLPSGKSCVVTLDESAIKVGQFDLSGRIRGAVKMSRDRQYVALTIQYGGSIINDTYLEIYDRNGYLISDERVGTTAVTLHFDWLPDGRLVYSSNYGDRRSIYVTLPYSAKVERQLSLPSGLKGAIHEVAASPDGKQLAFGLVDESNFAATVATPWVVNVDGSNFRQLAVDPHAGDDEHTHINNPKWSPDGRWILVKYGGARGGSISNPGVLGYLFAVPSDGVKVPLSPGDDSVETSARQIRSYWYSAFFERPGSIFNSDRWPRMDYDWIP